MLYCAAMSYQWREWAKRHTSPQQRHRLIMLREHLVRPYTRATARWRALPDFIIIGAARSGTTQLFNTLRYHPQVEPARLKEVHFFDKNERYRRGLREYQSYFPLRHCVAADSIVGEATPRYLTDPLAAERIQGTMPNTKLVVLLRDPVEVTLSAYFYGKAKGRITETLEEYFSETCLQDQPEQFLLGRYYEQLVRYDYFLKRQQLHVIKSEDFFNSKVDTMRTLCQYLGIATDYTFPDLPSRNQATREEVTVEVHQRLKRHFQPENESLYSYLNRDFAW